MERVRVVRALAAAALAAGLLGAGTGTEQRTPTATLATGPDGTRVLTLWTGTVQLLRGTAWVPVDLDLVTGPDGVVRPTATEHDLRLTPTGPEVRWTGGGSAALDWPTVLPPPVLDGHRATYRQARPGYDLVVEATGAGFVASLHRTAADAAPAEPLALRGRAESPVPAAAPATARTAAEAATAVDRVVASPPAAAGAAPVPFDTTLQSTVLRTDLSGDPDLRLGSYDGVAAARSHLTWDLTGLAGQRVERATLRVHQDWSSSCRPAQWQVWSAPAAGPATRWTDRPVADRMWATSAETRGNGPACAPGWTEVDVTDLVRSWAASGVPSAGMQLRAADETDPLGGNAWARPRAPHAPHLRITLG